MRDIFNSFYLTFFSYKCLWGEVYPKPKYNVNHVHISRLPMSVCMKCDNALFVAWADGVYMTEIDRVLRPGGYWILSGPPINYEKHWRGWERTHESLKEEQDGIEDVAKSLCWKKLVQKDDLAVWQKPTNHAHCKLKRKIFKSGSRPLCGEAQDPDTAW